MKPNPESQRPNERETARGVIVYVENGKQKQWTIGCMAWETEQALREHLAKWRPDAQFVSGTIVPDNKTV